MLPFWSTFTLLTELVVTAGVLYSIKQGYQTGQLPARVLGASLLYEVIVNISYMAHQAVEKAGEKVAHSGLYIGLAIFHGVFSLLMFVSLLVFMLVAMKSYKKGSNFFRSHKIITGVFLVFWLTALFSGIAFYIASYILKIQ